MKPLAQDGPRELEIHFRLRTSAQIGHIRRQLITLLAPIGTVNGYTVKKSEHVRKEKPWPRP